MRTEMPSRAPSSTNNRQLSPREVKPTARRWRPSATPSSRAAAKPTTAAPTQRNTLFRKSMATRSSSRSTATPLPLPLSCKPRRFHPTTMLRRPGLSTWTPPATSACTTSVSPAKSATGSSMTRRKPTPSTSLAMTTCGFSSTRSWRSISAAFIRLSMAVSSSAPTATGPPQSRRHIPSVLRRLQLTRLPPSGCRTAKPMRSWFSKRSVRPRAHPTS